MKISEINRSIKGVFKPPIRRYYLGKVRHGMPYFYPWDYLSTVLQVRWRRIGDKKEIKPRFRRTKYFEFTIAGYEVNVGYGWPVSICNIEMGWKDKYSTPRYEWGAGFHIYFFLWQFCIFWHAPIKDEDTYWEMVLWYLHYSNRELDRAQKTWPWRNMKEESTWNKDALL